MFVGAASFFRSWKSAEELVSPDCSERRLSRQTQLSCASSVCDSLFRFEEYGHARPSWIHDASNKVSARPIGLYRPRSFSVGSILFILYFILNGVLDLSIGVFLEPSSGWRFVDVVKDVTDAIPFQGHCRNSSAVPRGRICLTDGVTPLTLSQCRVPADRFLHELGP